MKMENKNFDIIIIGGGPAGLTAGIYLSRAKVNVLIVNEGISGGQMVLTHQIANYPGFENISGYALSKTMEKQAKAFGCNILSNVNLTKVSLNNEIKKVEINSKDIYTSKAVIIATGGKSRELGVIGEKDFAGKGVSYCATCDGDFFQNKEIFVVGGGNSALEEAVSLTQYASKVTIIHEFDYFQANNHAIEEAKKNSKIDFILNSTITGFYGEESLKRATVKNLKTGEEIDKNIDGVFIFIGYVPQSEFFKEQITTNSRREIIVDKNLMTNIPGVFAAGDVIEKRYRQITTAVSDGTVAALNAIEFIQK
jgi:thioredoxin reductase (NADPH)